MNNILEIKNITKNYKNFTLKNINFTLPTGSIMGFIGENGAGKSTTIKLILDLITKDSGDVTIFGSPLTTENKEHIGVVMDECNFPDALTIDNIEKIMMNCYKTWNRDTFKYYQNKFTLPQNKPIKEFSKGTKMKLSIAVALSHDSKLLILDEATSGLDPMIRDEILDVFLEFIQDESRSILLSSHIISDLEKICDYITFIHQGTIVFSNNKDDLLDQYKLLKCSKEEYDHMEKHGIIGIRENRFGIEALVDKKAFSRNVPLDPVSIEDIMIYFTKENR